MPSRHDTSSAIAFLCDPRFKTHDTGPHHPETARRIDAVYTAANPLLEAGLLAAVQPTPATLAQITAVHTEKYAHLAEHEIGLGLPELSTGDTVVCPASWDAALLAAGAACQAVDLVATGKYRHAFAAPRPPGHHAEADRGMGFCVFNNVAVAARHAQRVHGLSRVLVVDWDVHHGNGTQFVFYDDPSVLVFSTHQAGLYPPHTGWDTEAGEGDGVGYNINRPVRPRAGRAEILGAFEADLATAAAKFNPDLVMISAGFDSRVQDPLGDLRLTDDDFADLTCLMQAIANDCCNGKLVSVLEGGYSLPGLTAACDAHLQALAGAWT